MNSRAIAAAILVTVFCTGLAMAATPSPYEWSDIQPDSGRWSRIYFDYQQTNPNGSGTFYCINDWVVNQEDNCIHGGLVCDSLYADSICEANLFQFRMGTTEYTIKIYKNKAATITPSDLLGLVGKFSWNTSVNEPNIAHAIWEFSFDIKDTFLVNFTGHDPAVPSDTVWNPGPPSIIHNDPSTHPHEVDGLFADYGNPGSVGCSPHNRSFIPDNLLPKDPRIPPLKIILHKGGGVTVIPQGQEPIPTLTEWGLIVLVLVLLALGTWVFFWRRKAIAVRF